MALGIHGFHRGAASIPKSLVTYNVDTGTSYQEKVKKGQTVLSPTSFTPTKTGYTFLGWREDNLPVQYVLTNKVATGKPMTLYAVFTQTITLSYDGNGSDGGSTASQTGTRYWNNSYAINPTFTISANGYTKTDNVFVQWHKDSASGTAYAVGDSLTIGQDTTMYAEWLTSTVTFDYTGAMQVFNALANVTYRLQIYGAQGGTTGSAGGAGGYTEGYKTPTQDETWYVGVGGQGGSGTGYPSGGYNGGGYGFGGYGEASSSGGGASHVGYTNDTLRNTPVANLIAAAGGGGGGKTNWNGAGQSGGAGGGTSGSDGDKSTWGDNYGSPGLGGSQTAAGYARYVPTKGNGGYGYGGNAVSEHASHGDSGYQYCACGGGGGYYGGGGG